MLPLWKRACCSRGWIGRRRHIVLLIWLWVGLVVQDVNKDSTGYEDILKAGFDSGLWYETEEDQMEIVVGNPTYIGHEMDVS